MEDYYLRGVEQGANSQFYGKGAEALGLEGPVREEEFRVLCSGEDTAGNRLVAPKLTRDRESGELVKTRRAGNDCTFSAPKSVSIAYFAGVDGVKEAHDAAVLSVLGHLEEHYCHYRSLVGILSVRQLNVTSKARVGRGPLAGAAPGAIAGGFGCPHRRARGPGPYGQGGGAGPGAPHGPGGPGLGWPARRQGNQRGHRRWRRGGGTARTEFPGEGVLHHGGHAGAGGREPGKGLEPCQGPISGRGGGAGNRRVQERFALEGVRLTAGQ